ncbi:MAG: PAS domain S-box protein [Proteobacteria bacterium]|nr:PAS domain S-box protein [Pseudomonadota bacterium]MBU1416983.1 PAS domain S-box protein [Pseudomonadota bacterium]MBU1453679.1 PAS domain S-box protein [Pseudomonadota bacterium]
MDFSRRNDILLAINELAASDAKGITCKDTLLKKCCQIIMQNQEYCLIWAGKRDIDDTAISPLVALTSANIPEKQCMYLVEQVITDMHESNPAAKALLSGTHIIYQDVLQQTDSKALRDISLKTGFRSCSSWPLKYKEKEFGVLNIHSEKVDCFTEEEVSFLKTVVADISLALYSQEMTQRMQVERDFNREIVDTMQALLVSISPCGQILSFNHKAEEITGYKEEEVLDLYWVDVLMAPEHRKSNQQLLANLLKGEELQINFESCLLTKDNQNRTISWHGSFRQNIQQGKVGLVLFGVDITGQIQAGQHLNQAIAKWENIFSAIQDPALIVSNDSIILDANIATFTAARKTRSEVIGRKVCDILHNGRTVGSSCPLEQQIETRQSRIIETELRGLHGNYLLTVSPLQQLDNDIEATLLVARNLSEEERIKAEAIRAAQLASLGELAAGVAHEINNPINGIINYAQIILDDPSDADTPDLLKRIIKEGKRVASIVYNLLDFSRQNSEVLENVSIHNIAQSCLELVGHQFRKDQTRLEFHWQTKLANVRCNAQQIQQVLLNVLSNARYALNKRFPKQHPQKKIFISSEKVLIEDKTYIRLTITDNGTGIEQDIIDRVFDPFYSTKPKGEGTGLGLSISHGLIHDNKGFLRIKSEFGSFTSVIIDLPSSDY